MSSESPYDNDIEYIPSDEEDTQEFKDDLEKVILTTRSLSAIISRQSLCEVPYSYTRRGIIKGDNST